MAQLVYIDEELLKDSDNWSADVETFEKALSKIVDDTTRYADDKALWSAFTPQQRAIVEEYYKGFAIDTYSELEGTVRLQIEQKDARVKQRIKEMEADLGFAIKPDEWAYDGFKDLVDSRATCNFCKGSKASLRYVHYAVNKKRKVMLRFGCDCAANFFSTAPDTFTTIKTLQSKLLCDVKTLACICDEMRKGKKDILKYYYRYKGRYIGRLFMKDGELLPANDCIKQLEEIYTFKLETTPDGKALMGNDEKGYLVSYRNSTKPVLRSAEWVKDHIIYCLNADLDSEYSKTSSNRKLVIVDTKEHLKNDNTAYVNCAINFLRVGLPVPVMVCDKITSKVASATRQHHPDYMKFVSELLLHKHLSKTSLLRTAFTDFFVDYVTTKSNTKLKDPELKEWGVGGIASYYNTVLNWEAALVRLHALNEYLRLVKAGYIPEKRMSFAMTTAMKLSNSSIPAFLTYSQKVPEYIRLTTELFLSNKPVLVDKTRMNDGVSKYSVEGIDTTLHFTNTVQNTLTPFIDTRYAAYHITVVYKLYQAALKRLILNDFHTYKCILKIIGSTTNELQLFKLLLAMKLSNKPIQDTYRSLVGWRDIDAKKVPDLYIDKYYKNVFDNKVAEYLQDEQHKAELVQLRNTAINLYDSIVTLAKQLTTIDVVNLKITDVQNENKRMLDDTAVKVPEKTAVEYYKAYCDMLTNKPATETITKYLEGNAYDPILTFKDMQGFKDLFTVISDICSDSRVYDVLSNLENTLHLKDYFGYLTKGLTNFFVVARAWVLLDNRTDVTNGEDPQSFDINNVHKDLYNYLHNAIYATPVNGETSVISEFVRYCENKLKEYQDILASVKEQKDITDTFKLILTFFDCNKKNLSKKKLLAITSVADLFTYIKPEMKFYDHIRTVVLYEVLEDQLYLGLKDKYVETVNKALSEAYDKFMAENAERIQRELEQQQKQPLVEKILNTSAEHIAVFETKVTAQMKAKYKGKREQDILRKETFKKVRYENAEEKLKHFYNTLIAMGFSEECASYIEMTRKHIEGTDVLDRQKLNALVETLCTELYNHNYIYNHIETITPKVFKILCATDLYQLSMEELEKLYNITSVYYVTYTDMYAICEFIAKCIDDKNVVENFVEESNNLAEPVQVVLSEKYASLSDLPDENGLSGVDKAEKVLKHPDVLRIPDMLMRICRTVVSYKSCSPKQLHYVNKAYAILFPDEVVTETKETTQDTETVTDETQYYVSVAETVKAHANFDTLPERNKAIIESVLERKTCSAKQYYWVRRSAQELGVNVSVTVNA